MTSLPQRWALTSTVDNHLVSASELAQIAAACQEQLQQDVAHEWPEAAHVSITPFPDPHSIPFGYSVASIVDLSQMPQGALGFHYGTGRKPMAKLGLDPNDPSGISVTASHELIEAAVDPSGSRTVLGDVPGVGQREVLVEAADPCEAFTYLRLGVPVSDFVTRAYYGPHRWRRSQDVAEAGTGGVTGPPVTRPFSFTGHLDAPLVVAKGGYLSFHDAQGHWQQITWFGGSRPAIRTLGQRDDADPRSHREWVDSQTEAEALPLVGLIDA